MVGKRLTGDGFRHKAFARDRSHRREHTLIRDAAPTNLIVDHGLALEPSGVSRGLSTRTALSVSKGRRVYGRASRHESCDNENSLHFGTSEQGRSQSYQTWYNLPARTAGLKTRRYVTSSRPAATITLWRRHTRQKTLPFSRDWNRSASGPGCTSEVSARPVSTTSSGRFSTTPLTRP